MSGLLWDKPKSRNVGLFIDLSLYSEAMEITAERGSITASHLRQELRQRTHGLLLVTEQSQRVAMDLTRELHEFGWLEKMSSPGQPIEHIRYRLTAEGATVLQLSAQVQRRRLAEKMQTRYTIPGWLIARLWRINPAGQGEVILPSPPADWKPESRPWEQKDWTDDLAVQALRASKMARAVCLGSFPTDDEIWIGVVRKAWAHLGTWGQKARGNAPGEKIRTFSPRDRLSLAMRSAAVEVLFGSIPPGYDRADIKGGKLPLLPRTFRVWCPRLADLELIFYTDKHPEVVGRLMFPTAVFRADAPRSAFERIEGIYSPDGESSWLYQPRWEDKGDLFLRTLIQTHSLVSRRKGTLYVSLLDVRDEVCRQLRLSAPLFDKFLANAFRETLRPGASHSISLETDIREDQRSGSGLLRRPVWIEGVPYSLIAIGRIQS